MSTPAITRSGSRLVRSTLGGAAVLVAALIAGAQFVNPSGRVLQVIAAGFVVFFMTRISSLTALVLVVIMFPFPKTTSYGNTNIVLVVILFMSWLIREMANRRWPLTRTPVDLPILLMVGAYLLSFYNVEPDVMKFAVGNFVSFLSYVAFLIAVYHIARTESALHKVVVAQTISCALVCLLAVWEQFHPGGILAPGWLDFRSTVETGLGVRVGSVFQNYELFGEYCAISLLFQLFLFFRVASRARRLGLVLLMILTLYCLFSTVTRGAVISLLLGFGYLVWAMRRTLKFHQIVAGSALLLVAVFGMDFLVSQFTNSTSTIERLQGTTFVSGMPDSRAGAWQYAWDRYLEHPLIGGGPYYDVRPALVAQFWPHNVYLFYANIIGVVGLFGFLWLLLQLWRACRPRVERIDQGGYAAGLVLVLRASLFTFIVDQVKIDYIRSDRYSFFIWFFFGLIIAAGRIQKEHLARAAAAHDTPEVPVHVLPGRSAPPPVARAPRVAPRPAVG